MAADNHTTIVGNLADDPELRFTNTAIPRRQPARGRHPADPTGRRVARRRHQLPQDQRLRGQAEHLADSLAKGDRVMVTGRLRQRSWETSEGEMRSVTEIEADEVGASLKWATAKVERASQGGNDDRNHTRERQAERSGDFNDGPPF
jgi:single-strand DNA-binding protein